MYILERQLVGLFPLAGVAITCIGFLEMGKWRTRVDNTINSRIRIDVSIPISASLKTGSLGFMTGPRSQKGEVVDISDALLEGLLVEYR